jgi:hypothetical protein
VRVKLKSGGAAGGGVAVALELAELEVLEAAEDAEVVAEVAALEDVVVLEDWLVLVEEDLEDLG